MLRILFGILIIIASSYSIASEQPDSGPIIKAEKTSHHNQDHNGHQDCDFDEDEKEKEFEDDLLNHNFSKLQDLWLTKRSRELSLPYKPPYLDRLERPPQA